MIKETFNTALDIGTTTTQLVFSKIIIDNMLEGEMGPRFSVKDKKVIYKSKIIYTPLLEDEKIDTDKIITFIENQYKKFNFNLDDIKLGTIIITGEIAREKNYAGIKRILDKFPKEFKVHIGKINCQSYLSSKGTNIKTLSKVLDTSIANIDIGGETSNISYFAKGKLIDFTCLNIGGRLIKINKRTKKIEYISDDVKYLSNLYKIKIKEGDFVDIKTLRVICKLMAKIIGSALNICDYFYGDSKLFANRSTPLMYNLIPNKITFSGGVGKYIYEGEKDLFKYNDIGIILSEEIKKLDEFSNIEILKPKETISATVIGAGMNI